MTGRKRPNPQARPEYVDQLTGKRVSMGAPGATRTGRLLTRVRPPEGGDFEVVPVDPEDLDPSRDTYGIDPAATSRLRAEAKWVRSTPKPSGKAMTRGADLDLGRAGATTTFSSNKKAAQTFMDQNAHLFGDPLFEDIDIFDVTRDFMDGIEVRSGNRYVRLSKTNRGEEILRGGDRSSGGAVAEEMLAYLMGYAGSRRRWRDVPWSLVTSYVMQIQDTMQEEAQRKKRRAPGGGVRWYPLSSGMYDAREMLSIAVDEIGEHKAQRLADWMNSQALFDLADRIKKVLAPPKGSSGKAARRAKKCLALADRKAIRRRLETIEEWAKYPASVPQWACVSTREMETTAVSLCVYPGLEQEVRKIENACAGYDPSWPAKERARLCAAGDSEATEYGAGVAPLGCPEDVEADDAMDIPWENPRRRNADDEFDDEDESDAPQSYKDFSAWVRALSARKKEFIAEHRAIFERDGIVTVPGYDGRYTLVLTRGTTSPYRVTDFLGEEPTGHSERDTLDDALAVLWEDATAEYRRSPPQPKRATNPSRRLSRLSHRIANP